MGTKAMLSIALCLFIAGLAAGTVPATSNYNGSAIKGYITVDRNVVVLPERLQFGDRIELFKTNGARVVDQYVGARYLSTNISNIPTGVYNVVVYRANKVLATATLPIIGNERR